MGRIYSDSMKSCHLPTQIQLMYRIGCIVSVVAFIGLCVKLGSTSGPSVGKYFQNPSKNAEIPDFCSTGDCVLKPKPEGKVTLTAAACGNRLEEVLVMVKSAILLTNLQHLEITSSTFSDYFYRR